MYRELGFIRVWGSQISVRSGGVEYAYLIYPHRPVIAYAPQTGRLLGEYCVEFPDDTRPYGTARLPDSDDVLAKWMALTGDEQRLLASANLHLPGRQVDAAQVDSRSLASLALGAGTHARIGIDARRRARAAVLQAPDRRPKRGAGRAAGTMC